MRLGVGVAALFNSLKDCSVSLLAELWTFVGAGVYFPLRRRRANVGRQVASVCVCVCVCVCVDDPESQLR